MDRSYLLKIIEKTFMVFDKDELSQKIADNPLFDKRLKKYIQEQDSSLDNQEYLPIYHRRFYDTIMNLLRKFNREGYDFEQERQADAALLAISIYYHYSAICLPCLMYRFIREVLKEKILLV